VSVLGLWGGAYLAARALAASGDLLVVLRAVAVAGLFLLPALVFEIFHANVFLELFPSAVDPVSGIGVTSTSFGSARIQGAFGHPIPLAIFLIFSAGCCFTVWTTRDKRRAAGHLWLLGAVALLVAHYFTYSRTGYLMLGGAAAMLLLGKASELLRGRHMTLIVALAAVATLILATGPLTSLFDSSSAESQERHLSSEYRLSLLHYGLTSGQVSLLGSAEFNGPAHTETLDNAYLQYAFEWGYLPGLGLLAVGASIMVAALRMRNEPLGLGVAAVTFGAFVALSVVALLQQQQVLIWLLAGATSGTLSATTVGSEVVPMVPARPCLNATTK